MIDLLPPIQQISSRADQSGLRSAWGAYLSSFEWSHFCTLTSLSQCTSLVRREFLDGFVRRLTRLTQRGLPIFYAIESGTAGFAHMHALIAGTKEVDVRTIQRQWRLGATRITKYDDTRPATFYVTKNMGSSWLEWDISRRLPPRHGRLR